MLTLDFVYIIWFQEVAADKDRSKGSLVKSIPSLPSAVPTTNQSPLADNRPASHHKLYQPLQLRHPPGPDPIPSCSVHCANTFLSIIECEFIHTGDAMQGDVRAVNTPIQLNSMHNSINNTQTFW